MAEYSVEYMQEHCIDVYFRYGDQPFHVLTYGTTIPAVLNDVDRNRRLQHQVAVDTEDLDEGLEVQINDDYVIAIREASTQAAGELARNVDVIPEERIILQMFKPAAQLGFYSYDCVEELGNGNGEYRLVAYPGEDVQMHEYEGLPQFEGIEVIERNEETGVVMRFRM